MFSLFRLLDFILSLYMWCFILEALLSWLEGSGILNGGHPVMQSVGRFLYTVTDPVLSRLRKVLPIFGGLDFSPMVAILLIALLRAFLP